MTTRPLEPLNHAMAVIHVWNDDMHMVLSKVGEINFCSGQFWRHDPECSTSMNRYLPGICWAAVSFFIYYSHFCLLVSGFCKVRGGQPLETPCPREVSMCSACDLQCVLHFPCFSFSGHYLSWPRGLQHQPAGCVSQKGFHIICIQTATEGPTGNAPWEAVVVHFKCLELVPRAAACHHSVSEHVEV